jgi:L-amino acid N-acyltransferase YncA
MSTNIRLATIEDAQAIASIYAYYVDNTAFTFDTETPSAEYMRGRMLECSAIGPWLVAECEGVVRGYAHAGKHRIKRAYDWSVDVTIYVDHRFHRGGFARSLYEALLARLDGLGFYTAYAGITLPNEPSVKFHEAFGFKYVGTYHDVGFKHNSWRHVGWWEKKLKSCEATPRPVSLNSQDLTRVVRGDLALTSDRRRMNLVDIHDMLGRSHWATNRSADVVRKSVENSLCFGVLKGDRQVAFARVVTDYCTFAYLCDVYVHEDYRGRGLSKWMMDQIMAHADLQNLRRFLLATLDAHSLYEAYGFKPLSSDERQRMMGIRKDGI